MPDGDLRRASICASIPSSMGTTMQGRDCSAVLVRAGGVFLIGRGFFDSSSDTASCSIIRGWFPFSAAYAFGMAAY